MTRISSIFLALGTVLASMPLASLAQENHTAELVLALLDKSDPATAPTAFLKLADILRNGSPSEVKSLQQLLCQHLATATDTRTMCRISLALASAPCDEAVALVVDRLQASPAQTNSSADMRAAVCQSLGHLLSRRLPADPRITALVLSRLEAISRDHKASLNLLEEAMKTIGLMGADGFDALMRLRDDPQAPKGTRNLLYSALAGTGDGRALPVLRTALEDSRIEGGRRIQAVNAIGWLFDNLNRRDETVDPAEQALCRTMLCQYLADETPDQLFSVALKSLIAMTPGRQDDEIRTAIRRALYSASSTRQEAALDVLAQRGLALAPEDSDLVRSMAESHADESVRSAAATVVEQIEPDADEEQAASPAAH